MKVFAPTDQHPAFDPCLSAAEAANYLCMHVETLKELARFREICSVRSRSKKGSRVKFRLSELNRWAKSHEVKASRVRP